MSKMLTGEDLIGTKSKPAGYDIMRYVGIESCAYYKLDPYPYFAFREWRTESRGPLPRCLPLGRAIIRKGALWLFGKPIKITCTNETLQKSFDYIWKDNYMPSRLFNAACQGGQEGGVVLKFAVDSDKKVRIQILSANSEVKFFYDPHDRFRLLMARVQYPYFDLKAGKWYWFREEWTDTRLVTYKPLEIINYRTSKTNPYFFVGSPLDADVEGDWQVEATKPNPFKLIPFVYIKNSESDDQYGIGDMWSLWRILDRINLAYHLMDRSNQLDSDPIRVFIDLQAEQDELDRGLAPGQSISMKSDETEAGQSKEGRVQILEAEGKMRAPMENYAHDLRDMLYEVTGTIFTRPEDITNKGNLTQSVLVQLYAPLIEVTTEKRKVYGDNGLVVFFHKVCEGLANFGLPEFKTYKKESDEFGIKWPSFFRLSSDEKLAELDRIRMERDGQLITQEVALRKVADLEELEDPKELDELKDAEIIALMPPEPKQTTEDKPDGKSRSQKRGTRVRDTA